MISILLFTLALASAEDIDPCAGAAAALRQTHKKLYDVDTRPLAIDEYRNYRAALEELSALVDRLDVVCQASLKPVPTTLFKKTSFQTIVRNSADNPCGGVDYRAGLSEFEATSIRECYKEGYRDCRVKFAPRLFNRTYSVDVYTWTCKAEADLLLDVVR